MECTDTNLVILETKCPMWLTGFEFLDGFANCGELIAKLIAWGFVEKKLQIMNRLLFVIEFLKQDAEVEQCLRIVGINRKRLFKVSPSAHHVIPLHGQQSEPSVGPGIAVVLGDDRFKGSFSIVKTIEFLCDPY